MEEIPACRSHPLPRFLHRQLSVAGTRAHSPSVRTAEWLARQQQHGVIAMKLDLVLINPASRRQVYQSLGADLAAVENPVWAGLMAAFCRLKGLSVEIIDAEAEELSPEGVA